MGKPRKARTIAQAIDDIRIVHAALVIDGDDKKARVLERALKVLRPTTEGGDRG